MLLSTIFDKSGKVVAYAYDLVTKGTRNKQNLQGAVLKLVVKKTEDFGIQLGQE